MFLFCLILIVFQAFCDRRFVWWLRLQIAHLTSDRQTGRYKM